MKKGIHPELHEITARCACGSTIKTRSTATDLRSTLCSACHPFFTGKQKFVDTAGRLQKFAARYEKADLAKQNAKTAKKTK